MWADDEQVRAVMLIASCYAARGQHVRASVIRRSSLMRAVKAVLVDLTLSEEIAQHATRKAQAAEAALAECEARACPVMRIVRRLWGRSTEEGNEWP